jgi:hypothetical protein
MPFGQNTPDPMKKLTLQQLGPLSNGQGGTLQIPPDIVPPADDPSMDGLDLLRQEGQNPHAADVGQPQYQQPSPLPVEGDPTTQQTGLTAAPAGTGGTADSSGAALSRIDKTDENTNVGQKLGESSNTMGKYDVGGGDFSVLGGPNDDPEVRAAIAALYGDDVPLLKDSASEADWVAWAEHLWLSYGPAVQAAVHLIERNRLFRKGMQWISSIGFGPWREPQKARDTARAVDNVIAPALDQRVQLLREQRPGFQTEPENQDPDNVKRAQAQQYALEYQWHQQDMQAIVGETAFWAGTDGCAFWELYWDTDRGPWHEVEQYQDPEIKAMLPFQKKFPLGDIGIRCRRIEQVRVSPEATATRKPWLWMIREVISKNQAVREYGTKVAQEAGTYTNDDNLQHVPANRMGFILPELDELQRQQTTVDRYIIYADKSEYLPNGFEMVVVGRALVVPPMPLKIGRVPMVRFTDGSTDPAFYCTPEMNKWVESQIRHNALWSKWIEGIRKMASVNLLARESSLSGETLVTGTMNIFSVKGSQPVGETVQEIGGFSMAADLKEAMALNIKRFEDLTGWNDTTRGSFSGDQSGRAILAIREQVERVFAPMVNTASDSMTAWAKLSLEWMKWGYDIPRMISVQGESRQDLAQEISSDDFDHVTNVWIDPETLMPMPRALRLSILDDMFQKQLISPQEYRQRMPFAWTRALESADADHDARAHRVAAMIEQTSNPLVLPILWMDDEHIHQTVLEKMLLLDDDKPEKVRAAAYERWQMLAQQAQYKQRGETMPMPGQDMSGLLPPPRPQGPPAGPGTAAGLQGPAQQMGAQQAPLAVNNPPVAAAPAMTIGGTDQQNATRRFEHAAPK